MQIKRLVHTLFVALPVLAGCRSDEKLNAPAVGDPTFRRYVSMGNSITAGFQSAGINDSTQQRSYARLLSMAMGTSFNYPRLNGRGCPPPFTNNVTGARVGAGTSTTCDLRIPVSGTLNNLAVPGARVEELLNNFGTPVSASNALTQFLLGGRTQVELLATAQPTFVSAWAGNNDVLGSLTNLANPGTPLAVTPLPLFQQQYDSLADAITATGARAILIGVADVSVIPYASLGATYWCIKNQPACGTFPAQLPDSFQVALNCAPAVAVPTSKGDSTLVPWPIWVPKLGAALAGIPDTLDCSVDSEVVTAAEFATLRTAVAGYNAHIQSVATAHGWAFWNPNPTLLANLQTPLNPTGVIPAFPDVSQVGVGGAVGFGPLFTQDGVHPSSTTHRIVADSLASTINAFYNTSLPVPVCGAVTCPTP